MDRGFTRCLISTKKVHNLGALKMDINIHDVTEVRITKTAKHKRDGGEVFYTKKLIITDIDNRTFTIDVYSSTENGLKVVNKERWDI